MAGHVAEQLVTPRSQAESQFPDTAGLARLENPDFRRFERVLIDGDAIGSKRKCRIARSARHG